MPIRLLSLPVKDIQYALQCMDICDLIAFSLCSKRTKNLVKSSNRKMHKLSAIVGENYIRFDMISRKDDNPIYLYFFDAWAEIDRGDGFEDWRKEEFTQSDWIAHFLSIFNKSMIDEMVIENISLSYLESIQQFVSKCKKLKIGLMCSKEVTRITFLKLSPIVVEAVEVQMNISDKENDISKFLILNVPSASFIDWVNPFELKLNDLLVLNIGHLSIGDVNITENELNRFLKIWLKRNHSFYRPERIWLFLQFGRELNFEEVMKGIKYQTVEDKRRLRRGDGKELEIRMAGVYIDLKFQ